MLYGFGGVELTPGAIALAGGCGELAPAGGIILAGVLAPGGGTMIDDEFAAGAGATVAGRGEVPAGSGELAPGNGVIVPPGMFPGDWLYLWFGRLGTE